MRPSIKFLPGLEAVPHWVYPSQGQFDYVLKLARMITKPSPEQLATPTSLYCTYMEDIKTRINRINKIVFAGHSLVKNVSWNQYFAVNAQGVMPRCWIETPARPTPPKKRHIAPR
jgi:hypothetical protein